MVVSGIKTLLFMKELALTRQNCWLLDLWLWYIYEKSLLRMTLQNYDTLLFEGFECRVQNGLSHNPQNPEDEQRNIYLIWPLKNEKLTSKEWIHCDDGRSCKSIPRKNESCTEWVLYRTLKVLRSNRLIKATSSLK